MSDVLEKRVTDIETLVWEIPNLLNVRFARYETAINDNASRVAAVERVLVGLQTDVRDLRGGVTRQLVEQDRRLTTMEATLEATRQSIAAQDARLGAIEQGIAGQDDLLGAIERGIAGQDARLGAIEQAQEAHRRELDQKLDHILRLLAKT